MGRNNHSGNRKKRIGLKRESSLGYYLIITDTKETEKNYFNGLREALPADIKENIVIKVAHTKTAHLIRKAKELRAREFQFCQIWIVFDRDLVKNFDKIIEDAESSDMKVGWSNPCFEIWMAAYFGTMPTWSDSVECCREFGEIYRKHTGKEYAKNSESVYKDLMKYGDEDGAISLAKKKYVQAKEKNPLRSKQCPSTTVYCLVEEIRSKGRN